MNILLLPQTKIWNVHFAVMFAVKNLNSTTWSNVTPQDKKQKKTTLEDT